MPHHQLERRSTEAKKKKKQAIRSVNNNLHLLKMLLQTNGYSTRRGTTVSMFLNFNCLKSCKYFYFTANTEAVKHALMCYQVLGNIAANSDAWAAIPSLTSRLCSFSQTACLSFDSVNQQYAGLSLVLCCFCS